MALTLGVLPFPATVSSRLKVTRDPVPEPKGDSVGTTVDPIGSHTERREMTPVKVSQV